MTTINLEINLEDIASNNLVEEVKDRDLLVLDSKTHRLLEDIYIAQRNNTQSDEALRELINHTIGRIL